jgi:Domain of unknown function (DUF5615)
VRFLIDECLSIDLVTIAGGSGHEAQHVAHVGRADWKDWNVVRYARDGDFVLVTNNASDFRQLYAAAAAACRPCHFYPGRQSHGAAETFPRRARRARPHRWPHDLESGWYCPAHADPEAADRRLRLRRRRRRR